MEFIVNKIVLVVSSCINHYYEYETLQTLLRSKSAHFFEIKAHLEALTKSTSSSSPPSNAMVARSTFANVKLLLLSNLQYKAIAEFDTTQKVRSKKENTEPF